MAGASELIDIQFDDRKAAVALKRLQMAGAKLQPVFAEIGEHLLESTRQCFEGQVDPDGLPWEPLNPKTQSHKKKELR